MRQDGVGQAGKPTIAVIAENRFAPRARATYDQIVPTIAVQVEPGDAGSKLAEASRQQRLPGKIIKDGFFICVFEQLTDIRKERCRICWRRWMVRICDWRHGGLRLINFINSVALSVRNYTRFAVSPGDFYGQFIGD